MQGETKADRKHRRGAGGFSLIELMAVVLIMGILGTVVGVVVGPKIFTAKRSTTISSLRVIETELESYFMTNNVYPDALSQLDIKRKNDGWKTPFYYMKTEKGTRPYALSSAGKDTDHGTNDDIDVWTLDDPTN